MKAAYFAQTGDPEVIQWGDLPQPTPGDGEVLVRVKAGALNPIDTYLRAGIVAMQLPMPYVVGSDVAGTVEAVGPNVQRLAVGDRVWGSNQGFLGRQGAFAEFAAIHEDWLYPIPDGVSEEKAAAAALVGITAHLGLLDRAQLQPGETAFVNGGTGGVGSMVVQMAKAIDAKAICTVGSEEKANLCKSWGVDLVLNYKTDDVDAEIRRFTNDQGVDVWYETQREPNFVRSVALLKPRGRMIIMAGRQAEPTFPVGPFYVKGLSLHGFAMFNATPDEQRLCAVDVNRWMADGKLDAPIGKTFPMSETAAAHRFLEECTLGGAGKLIGKVVVTL